MSRARLATIYGLLAVLIGGHLFDNVTRREHWPFSNYPMFAGVEGRTLYTYRMTCLCPDGRGGTRERYFDPAWVPSLPQYKFADALRLYLEKRPDPVRLRRMLSDYLDTYDACRRAGLSGGPAVTALRVYSVKIPLEVPLRHVDLDHGFADFAKLAVQVDHPGVDPTPRPSRS